MEATGLTSLPIEVIHHISRYLSVQDVLSCSLTCHYLRTALNDNSVWSKYLSHCFSSLGTLEQQVTPPFHLDENLSLLCENRQHFVRRTHLINNWREGNCLKFKNKSGFSLRSGVFNKTKGKGNVIYDDRYIFFGRFINDYESDGIEVWEISNTPKCYTFLKINDVNYNCFFIVGSFLVVVECIKVFVYRITLPEKDFPLEFSFLISDKSVSYTERVEHSGIHDFRCVGWDHSIINNYLISNKCGESFIHFWDIKSASKLGCFESPIESFSIRLHSFIGKNPLFDITIQASSTHYLSVFDIEMLKFTNSMFSHSRSLHVLLFYPYIILFKNADDPNPGGWYDNICSIYDFNSSLKLKERRFDNASKNYMLSSVTIVNGRFVMLCNDGFHIVDALSLETVDMFESDDARFITKQMFLCDSLNIVATSNSNHKLELWDVTRKNKLAIDLKEVYTSHLYLDRLSTKLVIMNYDHVSVVHFW